MVGRVAPNDTERFNGEEFGFDGHFRFVPVCSIVIAGSGEKRTFLVERVKNMESLLKAFSNLRRCGDAAFGDSVMELSGVSSLVLY